MLHYMDHLTDVRKYLLDVREFQEKFGFNIPSQFTQLTYQVHQFRHKFMWEELKEFVTSTVVGDDDTAVDSLLDLMYVVAGTAIFHGLDQRLLEVEKVNEALQQPWAKDLVSLRCFASPNRHDIGALTCNRDLELVTIQAELINLYRTEHTDMMLGYSKNAEQRIAVILSLMMSNCVVGAIEMGLEIDEWLEMWDDVHQANMRKVRAESAEQSKRDHTIDVIKPVGWVPPRTTELMNMYRERRELETN